MAFGIALRCTPYSVPGWYPLRGCGVNGGSRPNGVRSAQRLRPNRSAEALRIEAAVQHVDEVLQALRVELGRREHVTPGPDGDRHRLLFHVGIGCEHEQPLGFEMLHGEAFERVDD